MNSQTPRPRQSRRLAPLALAASALLLASCSTPVADAPALEVATVATESLAQTPTPAPTQTPLASVSTSHLAAATVMAENADYTSVNTHEWSFDDAIDVNLANPSGQGVSSNGTIVTITEAGVYRLHGSLNGQVLVNASDNAQVVLVLDGAEVTNANGSAIEVQGADDVAIHLADGSTNVVADAASYAADAQANAAIFSQQDLTISGGGALTVRANGNDGITSKDDLVVLGGEITVVAADDALRGKDALVVEGGNLTLTATGGDGLKSDGDEGDAEIDWSRGYVFITGGTINISAGDDGVQAFTDTIIAGGSLTVDAVDDGVKGEVLVAIGQLVGVTEPTVSIVNSEEGIEAASIGITAGTTSVVASDDGINASGNAELQALMAGMTYVDDGRGEFADTGELLEISGGSLTVNAEGDGLDSNGSLTISGGFTTVYGPTMGGNGSLDADGALTVSGGTLVSFGPGSMEQTPSTGDQGWVLLSAPLAAGQAATVTDAAGNVIGEFTSAKNASTVIFSAPGVASGESYSIVAGGETVATATAGEGGFGGPGGVGGGPGQGGGPGRP